MMFKRIEAGLYRDGDIEIRDQYSPDGATHCRSIAKNGRRWAITKAGEFIGRESTLADAKWYVEQLRKHSAA
jgi:hypothetical protein